MPQTNLDLSEKIGKVVTYQVKSLRFTKIVKNFKFERVLGWVTSEKLFQRQMFSSEIAQWEKLKFHFSRDFCSYWQNFYFGRGTKH